MFPFFFFFLAFHTISAGAEPHSDIATTRLAERIAILLFTYIIGDIYIHFWSFLIRHHQTCYTVSLSLNCHFLCKCYSAQLVKYLKQGTVRDARAHTHTHTRGTRPRTYCIIHTKRSTLAQRTHTAAWELHTGQSVKVMGYWKCHFFLSFFFLMSWFAYSLTSRQVQDSGLRLW